MEPFVAALIQSRWRETPEENLENSLNTLDRIGRRGDVRLVALPEFFLGPPFFFPNREHLKGRTEDTIPGRITDLVAEKARRYSFNVVCGTIVERDGSDYYNTCPLIDDRGRLIGKARKMHCYGAELTATKAGNERLVVDTDLGRIGVCVCSDFWIEEVPRLLALDGAEIICVAGASLIQDIEITRPCILANSVNNVCYTLYTSMVGAVKGKRAGQPEFTIGFGGYTTASSPRQIMATLEDEEDVLFVDIDIAWLRKLREVDIRFKNTLYWTLWGRRPELYADIMKPYVEARQDLKEILSEYLRE